MTKPGNRRPKRGKPPRLRSAWLFHQLEEADDVVEADDAWWLWLHLPVMQPES